MQTWAQRAEVWGQCSLQAEDLKAQAQVKFEESVRAKSLGLDKAQFYFNQANRVARFAGTNPGFLERGVWEVNYEAACFYQEKASVFEQREFEAREEWEAANKAAREYTFLQANATDQAAKRPQAEAADQAAKCVEYKTPFVFF